MKHVGSKVRVALFGMPGHGHVNPTLPLVSELVFQNMEVHYFINKAFQDKVEGKGAIFHEIGIDHSINIGSHENLKLYEILPDLNREIENILEIHIETIKAINPNVILTDEMAIWGKDIAKYFDIPMITLQTTFLMDKQIILKYGGKEMVLSMLSMFKHNPGSQVKSVINFIKNYRERNKNLELTPKSHDRTKSKKSSKLVFVSKDFQPEGEKFGENVHFIGSTIGDEDEDDFDYMGSMNPEVPLIYVSLGTVVNNQRLFYKEVITALKMLKCNAIISCGSNIDPKEFEPLPQNIVMKPFVSQKSVLQNADVFITHGGMNSTQEGIYYEVPMLFYPTQGEQRMSAKQVESLGGGVLIKEKEVGHQRIYDYVDDILKNDDMKKKIKQMKYQFNSGGVKEAVEVISEEMCL